MSGPIRADGTVLGFDVGARRIGVAIGSSFGHGARALAVIDVHGGQIDWASVDRLHKEWRPDGLVVGDPMTLDGGDQPIRARARECGYGEREVFDADGRDFDWNALDASFRAPSLFSAQRLIELRKDKWELASYPLERHAYQHPASWYDQYRRIHELFERTLK